MVYDKLKNFNYLIAVPSRDRTNFLKKKNGVWRNFNRPYKDYPIVLVVREEELDDYKPLFDGKILTTENNTDITKTRQFILDYAMENGYEHLIMMDDDINLFFRDEKLSSKYTQRIEDIHANNVFDSIVYESLLLTGEEYPLTGVPIKQGSFSKRYTYEKNCMIIRYVCYYLPVWKKHNIRCDGLLGTIGVMEDYYVQLKLLSLGYRTLTNCRWAVGDYGTGYRGGCNATRTVEVQNRSAKKLCELFPEAVKLKVKTDAKQHWKEDRLDVNLKLKYYLNKDEKPYIPKTEIEEKYGIK